MSHPKVFVLILNYNGKNLLSECLPSVLAMDYPEFEVLVIDNGSSDGSAAYLQTEFPEVQTLAIGSNVGYSRGFNFGMERAAALGAEYFLIMNNDTVIDRGALRALVEAATTNERAGFVTGKVYFYDKPGILQTVGKPEEPILWSGCDVGWFEQDVGQHDCLAERVSVDHVYVLVSRKMYDKVGGYDPNFFLVWTEWDWAIRAKKAGWRVYYTPAAKLWHKLSASFGGLGNPINEYFLYRDQMVVLAKHAGFKRSTRYFAWAGAHLVKRLIGALIQLNPRILRQRLARFLGFLAGAWWLIRRQDSTRVPWLIVHLVPRS